MEMLRRATVRLVNTVGLPSLLALLVGVPALVGFVIAIWKALSDDERAIAIACIVLVVIAVVIFIYGQTRRELMIIPKIIYRMSERTNEIADNITFTSDSDELKQFSSLIGMVGHSFEKINDYETFKLKAPELIKEAQSRTNFIKRDPKQGLRVLKFIYEGHIRKVIEGDIEYQRLKNWLQSKWPTIPTTELSQNIIIYNKVAIIRCSCALYLKNMSNPLILDFIPTIDQLDAKIEMENLDEKLSNMLANVNQSIDRYYRNNMQKEDGQNSRK